MSRADFPLRPAIRIRRDGRVFAGRVGEYHEDVFYIAYRHYEAAGDEAALDAVLANDFEQGFVTSAGRFVDRSEAYDIAVAAGLSPDRPGYLDSWDLEIRKRTPGAHMVYR